MGSSVVQMACFGNVDGDDSQLSLDADNTPGIIVRILSVSPC